MTYASIMVHVAPGADGIPCLDLATDLARRTSAYLIGIAACSPPVQAVAGSITATTLIESEVRKTEHEFSRLQESFYERATTPLREWRDGMVTPSDFLAEHARGADLIVVGSSGEKDWKLDRGDLIMAVGRPVLIAARGCERLAGETVVIAWRNGPPAQRAILAAMPFLEAARKVIVLGVGDETMPDDLEDVAEALRRHRVHAETAWRGRAGRDESQVMLDFCTEVGADLLVSGAYGRPRLDEFLFGGVTRDLLKDQPVNRLLMH